MLLWTWLLVTAVHSVSINHGLLTAKTALSHQHAIDWVTDSIQTTLALGSNEALFFFFLFSYHLENFQEMKTRWLRIAVYNIKLHSYGRKRHKRGKKAYTVLCWRKWQGSMWGILRLWYPSKTASDKVLSRGYDLQHITHFQLTGALKCGFTLCYSHTCEHNSTIILSYSTYTSLSVP